jgi:hypothetical protein
VPAVPSRVRRAARAVVLPLGIAVLAGCAFAGGGSFPSAGSTPEDPIAGVRADIERRLTEREDVAAAEVRYRDDMTVPGSAAVDVRLEPGADPQALSDEAVRLVWQSELASLDSITVEVANPADPAAGVSRIVDLLDDAQRLEIESEFGPRPR